MGADRVEFEDRRRGHRHQKRDGWRESRVDVVGYKTDVQAEGDQPRAAVDDGPFGPGRTARVAEVIQSAEVIQKMKALLDGKLGFAGLAESEMDGNFANTPDTAFAHELEPDLVSDGLKMAGSLKRFGLDRKEAGHGIAGGSGQWAGE